MEYIKPLRNYLRQFNAISFLQAIWYLSNHLEFGGPLPAYLAAAHPMGKADMWHLGFFLWELDTLAREVILHSEPSHGKIVTGWSQVAIALNKLKTAEEDATDVNVDNIFSEMTRIAHRQFHWQQGVSHNDIARTRKIYRTTGMDEVVRDVYGLSAERVALAGFAATATYMEHFAITREFPENVARLLGFNPRPLIDNLTCDFATIRKSCHEARALNANWAYAFNPLWLHPLIRIEGGNRTICPMPGLLARRITDGLYFDIAGHDVDILSGKLGPSFQAFIGEVLDRANGGKFIVLPEEQYGTKKQTKDTVDWMVVDDTATLFVEVKLLKMGKAIKECLAPDETATAQLKKLAKAIGQIYATVTDALAGKYPSWKPNGKPVYPLIVTLDNWNLFTHLVREQLEELVVEDCKRRGVDPAIMKQHQYVVCCSNEFEQAIQVMHEAGIHEVMKDLVGSDRPGWLFSSHLRSSFGKELEKAKPLFPEERDRMLASVTPS